MVTYQFNVEIDETDETKEDLHIWKSCDATGNRPPPMIIETLIDTKDLTNRQSLIVIGEDGRRWDVEEALNSSLDSSDGTGHRSRAEVVLERWIVQLGEPPREMPKDIAPVLPRTYKNSIVLFRSLYACTRYLPAWKFGRKLFNARSSSTSPQLKYRILQGPHYNRTTRNDPLTTPLYNSDQKITEPFVFDPIDSPAGPISVRVIFRSNCNFQIDNSEAVLSSRFMGMDEQSFGPSLGCEQESRRRPDAANRTRTEIGSLPSARENALRPDHGQAYGSMSTFHAVGPTTGTSPMSALRNAPVAGSESPEDMVTRKVPPNLRSAQGSRSSLRSTDGAGGAGRRPSVSFQPFKAPSLSASPSQHEPIIGSMPRGSLGKTSPLAALVEARNPSYLAPSSRSSPSAGEPPPSGTGSPKPLAPQRFSSSFGHRKGKLSTGGSSRTEDDNSSGKASIVSSNAQPGSGILAEGETSSGDLQTDDDNIQDFLKLLNQKKDLKSFRSPSSSAGAEASTRRTSAALQKFQGMRGPNAALSESMSSSLMLQRSSTTSGRQPSTAPPMIAGTSLPVSTSPGKPVSPHTPHTPTVPSRLSANSIVDYRESSNNQGIQATNQGQMQRSNGIQDPNTGAIDIPTSPRSFNPSYRRSSSAAYGRALPLEDDEMFPFGLRSASLGVDAERPSLSLEALAAYPGGQPQDESEATASNIEQQDSAFGPTFDTTEPCGDAPSQHMPSSSRDGPGAYAFRGGLYRPRIGRRSSGRGETASQGSSSSIVDRGSASGSSFDRGGRYNASRPTSNFDDEEPLLFAMGDLTQSRRSLEDQRGSASERGGGDSGASSRRASRRGGY